MQRRLLLRLRVPSGRLAEAWTLPLKRQPRARIIPEAIAGVLCIAVIMARWSPAVTRSPDAPFLERVDQIVRRALGSTPANVYLFGS